MKLQKSNVYIQYFSKRKMKLQKSNVYIQYDSERVMIT